jgi:hypothetical protein
MSQSPPPEPPGTFSGTMPHSPDRDGSDEAPNGAHAEGPAAPSPPPAAHRPAAEDRADPTRDTPFASWSLSIPLGSGSGALPPAGQGVPTPTPPPAPLLMSIPAFGQVGRRRSRAVMVLLWVVTLGIYGLVWHDRVNREMSEFDPRLPGRIRRCVWALAIPYVALWTVCLVASALLVLGHGFGVTADLPVSYDAVGYLAAAPLAIPYATLLLPFSAIAVVMTAERVRIVEDRLDIVPELQLRPTQVAWWLLVPVVGGLVLLVRQQSRLNRAWQLMNVG